MALLCTLEMEKDEITGNTSQSLNTLDKISVFLNRGIALSWKHFAGQDFLLKASKVMNVIYLLNLYC
jgi:hypothetical protein